MGQMYINPNYQVRSDNKNGIPTTVVCRNIKNDYNTSENQEIIRSLNFFARNDRVKIKMYHPRGKMNISCLMIEMPRGYKFAPQMFNEIYRMLK